MIDTTSLADFSWYRGNLDWLKVRTIFLTKHGSHAYGTNLPTSDIDIKGIAIAPREYYLGFLKTFEQAEVREPIDAVIYEIRKFFDLAAKCNPNIIEVLFTNESDWILGDKWISDNYWTGAWDKIYENRDFFLSQKAQHTFSGYAFSQLNRIKTHRAWLLNPPKKQPERSDFDLKDGESTLGKEQLGIIEAKIRKLENAAGGQGVTKDRLDVHLVVNALESLNIGTNLLPIILAERRYAAACRNWSSYQKWKAERNPARAELEAKFGYDTKHAMHLVRLLRMAGEILGSGRVVVKRVDDAAELIRVRMGDWSYDQLMEYALKTEARLEVLAKDSPLPREPDRVTLDKLLVEVITSAL